MEQFVAYSITGLFLGAAYAIAASGLVLTYTTTRVFNLAHGAISMVMAFAYWQLHVANGVPTVPAVLLVLFVIAPLFGIAIERLVMRGLGEAPVGVSLVVTVGLFVFLVGLAQQFWPTNVGRNVSYFFGYESFPLFGVPGQLPLRDHHRPVRDRRRRPVRAAQPDPARHGHACCRRQPRAARTLRRQSDPGVDDELGARVVAGSTRGDPVGRLHRPGLLHPDLPGDQRVRRRDARPAAQPAADLRRRDRCSAW